MAGQASLQGGHGLAASLAPVVESLGGEGALTIGMTAATYGLIAGSLLGGPIGTWLINRNKVKIETDEQNLSLLESHLSQKDNDLVTGNSILISGAIIFTTLAIGLPTAQYITDVTGFTIPGHIFSLFLGILFRSFNDWKTIVPISTKSMEAISSVSLNMFLIMA